MFRLSASFKYLDVATFTNYVVILNRDLHNVSHESSNVHTLYGQYE